MDTWEGGGWKKRESERERTREGEGEREVVWRSYWALGEASLVTNEKVEWNSQSNQ